MEVISLTMISRQCDFWGAPILWSSSEFDMKNKSGSIAVPSSLKPHQQGFCTPNPGRANKNVGSQGKYLASDSSIKPCKQLTLIQLG
ncbi:hypothetical protein VNO78_21442 [Psophocarpus tetragonolobus]|uniref:Uncharacterized protein n=1 Tax=Psophocarpus tetragonolobus TaxID=3891 RepID=A0AAN9XHQ0_PSOTE